ncbi:MAG: PKD domain-containing protein [Saprospiraceae bacterium]
MKNLSPLVWLGAFFALIYACKKDDFPVPPASTVPNFTYTIDNDGVAPATVTFANTSIVPATVGAVSYYWNFGDNTSSEEANPAHIYEQGGAYQVRLVAVTSVSLEIKETVKTIVIKDPNASGTPVYFTDGSLVFNGLLNNQSPIVSQLPVSGLLDSYGTTFDSVRNHLYISDYEAGKIYRCNPDGSNQIEFRTGLDAPNAMSIDYQLGHIYWDTGNGIQRCDISSTDVGQKEDFVTGQANDPDGVSIDAVNRVLYWVNYNGGVWKKNLDGTGETELIPGVEGGSILVVGNRIFYDQYIGAGDIHLKSANLDGSGVAVLATGITRVVYALAYEPSGNKIYWGDRNIGTIMRANLDGSEAEPWYVDVNVRPRGLAFGKKF